MGDSRLLNTQDDNSKHNAALEAGVKLEPSHCSTPLFFLRVETMGGQQM